MDVAPLPRRISLGSRWWRRAAAPLLALAATLLAGPLTGCSAMKPETQVVTITTDDPEAEILIDGELAGRGSAFQQLRRTCDHKVVARNAVGEATADIASVPATSETVDKCLILCCCVGIPSLLTEGTRDLEPTELHLKLPLPAQGDAPPPQRQP